MRVQQWLGCVAISAGTLSGCAKSDEPSEQDYEEVANSVGALLEAEEDSAGATVSLSVGIEVDGLVEINTGTYSGTVAQGSGSIDYEYEISCEDADGNAQDACGTDTDSAELTVSWDGTWDGSFWDLDVSREGHWTVEGLLPATDVATFNGMGSFDVSASGVGLLGREHTLDLEYDAEYSQIQFNKDSLLFVGGEATYEVHGTRHSSGAGRRADAEFDITVEVQFLGGGSAMLTLDGSRHYSVDIDSGEVTGADE